MVLSACDNSNPTATPGGATPQPNVPLATTPTTQHNDAATPAGNAPPSTAGTDNTRPGGGTVPGDFNPDAVKRVEVEQGAVLHIASWGGPYEQQVTQDMLASFRSVYPDVQVKYEPEPSDYEAKIRSRFEKNNEPDLLFSNAALANELAGAGKLLKLNSVLDLGGLKEGDFQAPLLSMFKVGIDIYALPEDFGTLAVFYNAEQGTNAPKEGWNWDDFKLFAQSRSRGEGEAKVVGTLLPPDSARWLPFALANGVKVNSPDGTTDINSPQAVDALTYYHSLVASGYAAPSSDALGVGWAGEALIRKKVASVIEGNWLVPFLANPEAGLPKLSYGIAALPISNGGGRGNLLFARAVSISAHTHFPRAASALTLFLTGAENQREALRRGIGFPTLVNTTENGRRVPFRESRYFRDNPTQLAIMDAVTYGTPYYFGKSHNAIIALLNQALEAVQSGKAEPKAALDTAAAAINTLLKK